MEVEYSVQTWQAKVYYGQTLQELTKKIPVDHQLIVFTTPKLYEKFADRITTWYNTQTVSFYIMPQALYQNNLEELSQIIYFLRQFDTKLPMVWIAFGSESVVSLISFLSVHGEYEVQLYSVHHTIQSFVTALFPTKEIVAKAQVSLHTETIPKRIGYVQLNQQYSTAERMIDLAILIKYGYLTNRELLEHIFQTYQTPEQLATIPMTPFIDHVVLATSHHAKHVQQYERLFERAFYTIDGGHLLSANMKRFLGLFFHLVWDLLNLDEQEMCHRLFQWFQQLGYPVYLPKGLVLADYFIQVEDDLKQQNQLIRMTAIGQVASVSIDVTNSKLADILDYYQQEVKGAHEDERK